MATSSRVYTIDSDGSQSWSSLRELWNYRELVYAFTVRSIRTRYRQSVLGMGWAIAQPLLQMVVFNLVFGNLVKIQTDGIPYPIFSYAALVPWTFFANGVTIGSTALVANRSLVTKMWFPREAIILSEVGARLMDFGIGAAIFVGFMAWYQVPVTPWLLFIPVLLLVQTVLIVAITLFASALHVRFRDIAPIVTLGVQVWFFLSPVVYPLSQLDNREPPVSELVRTMFMLNPMVGLIEAYRSIIALGQAPNLEAVGISALVSLVLLAVAYPWFKWRERSFADII